MSFFATVLSFRWLDGLLKRRPAAQVTPDRREKADAPQLYAVLVGVDKYGKFGELKGAVADAERVRTYLVESLGTRESRIKTLLNSQATRGAILDTILGLATDSNILPDDPILLYFCGMGGITTSEDLRLANRQVECVIPFDYGAVDKARGHTQGIPAYTLDAALHKVAMAKGNNITLMLDCSFSTSANVLGVPRFISMDRPLPAELDKEVLEHLSGDIQTQFVHKTNDYIVLPALTQGKVVAEQSGRGEITTTLLRALEIVNIQDTTYSQLARMISPHSVLNQQTAFSTLTCNRSLFHSKVLGYVNIFHQLQPQAETIRVNAGSLHAISKATQLDLVASKDARSPILCPLTVDNISTFNSTISLPSSYTSSLPTKSFARQRFPACQAALRVLVQPDQELGELLQRLSNDSPYLRGRLVFVSSREDAEISLGIDSGEVCFDILSSPSNSYGDIHIWETVPLAYDAVHMALRSALRWIYHLRPVDDSVFPYNKVLLKFTELTKIEGKYDTFLRPLRVPQKRNLLVNGRVTVQPGRFYGMEITNQTAIPLYMSIFLFDSDFQILTCYPASADSSRVVEAIQPRSSRTVGYGSSGGESPLSFAMTDGTDTDGTPFDEPLTLLSEQHDLLSVMPVPMTTIVFPIIQRTA